jgi:hypothetical protein
LKVCLEDSRDRCMCVISSCSYGRQVFEYIDHDKKSNTVHPLQDDGRESFPFDRTIEFQSVVFE